MERDTQQLSCDNALSFCLWPQNDDIISVLYPPVDVQFNDEMFVNNKKSNVKPFIKFRPCRFYFFLEIIKYLSSSNYHIIK